MPCKLPSHRAHRRQPSELGKLFWKKLRQENLLAIFDWHFLSRCDPEFLRSEALLVQIDSLNVAHEKVRCGLCTWLSRQTLSWSSSEYLRLFEQAARFSQFLSDQNTWVEPDLWFTSAPHSTEVISTLDRCIQKLAAGFWKKWHFPCVLNRGLQIQGADSSATSDQLAKKARAS